MTEQALVLDEVVFSYDENGPFVFERLSLGVKHGEFVAVLGPNGTGKSTLARLIQGMIRPTRGEIRIEGISDGYTPNDSLHQRVGLVFQNPDNQMVASSVADEIAFGPCNLQWDAQHIRDMVDEALKRFDLYDLMDRPLHMLSGGEKRRVTLAAVWVTQPTIWVLDEPIAMLDAKSRHMTEEMIKKLHEDGETIIYLGHRIEEVICADRVLILSGGKIVWEGTPRRLLMEIDEAWGIALPEAARLWKQMYWRDKNGIPATSEELVEALWELYCKTSR